MLPAALRRCLFKSAPLLQLSSRLGWHRRPPVGIPCVRRREASETCASLVRTAKEGPQGWQG
eukprot:2613624-Rhodomonas_salina.2